MDINKNICEIHGLEYMKITENTFNVPLYWMKVFIIQDIIMKRKDIDYVLWLDSDAVFTHFNIINPMTIIEKYPDFSMWLSRDPPDWDAPFVAGAFMIKNDIIGRKIMKLWKNKYNKDRWVFKKNSWTTDGKWAGVDYEQGAFIEYILSNEKYKKYICRLRYYIFSDLNCENPHKSSMIIHLAGNYKYNIKTRKNCLKLDN